MIGQTISHYKVIEKLGGGGMGVVYKAEDTKLKRTVALKFLPPVFSFDQEAKKRFINEAQAASSLQHNNICNIHDIDETKDGQIFICMDCYEGETLKKKIECGQVKTDEAIDIIVQVAAGLQKAHEKGIIHRDIKPANIFITNDGVVKILDFGLAKLSGQTMMTKMGETVGTIAYMSPEQTRGELVDNRTDIWSLGVVLYEMLTRTLPFKGDYDSAMIYSILNEEPKHLTEVPKALQQILNKCLTKNPSERYHSIDELLEDLQRIQPNPSNHLTSRSKISKVKWIFSISAILIILVGIYLFLIKSDSTSVNRKSIAVLPFKNLSDSKEDEYFSDGITDDIIAQLSKISELKVISRTSTMHYKRMNKNVREIGEELDVATVLEGSVRRVGNQIRIVAQLIDAKNEGHLWAETYDKEMIQIFEVQSDVAKKIAVALQTKLTSGEKERIEKKQTENTEAYQLYLQGRFYWNKRTADALQKAVVYFNQAIEKDPGYALAYAGLASTYALLPEYSGLPSRDFIPNAETAAEKSLVFDPTLAEPHAVLGLISHIYQWNWEGAEKEFKRAIELDPNNPTTHHWYNVCLRAQAKFEEALAEIKRAQELDPLSPVISQNLAIVLYYMRHDDLAIEQCNKTLELDPNFPGAHKDLGWLYVQQSKYDKAISELHKVRQIVGPNTPYGLSDLGYIYARAGKNAEAIKILGQLLEFLKKGYTVSVQIASVYAGLGDKDKAFEWLDEAYNERNNYLREFKIAFRWDNLRSDPRYTAMLNKIGLTK